MTDYLQGLLDQVNQLIFDPATGALIVDADFTGDINVDIDKADKIEIFGSFTLTGAEDQLGAQALKSEIILKADSANAATLWIGDTGVTVGNGMPLEPGESVSFPVDNSNAIYFIGTAADKLHYMGG